MDAERAAQLVDEQFPELAPSRAIYLGEGCDSRAFEVNGRWVFRFPKNGDVARQMELESRLLPRMAPHLPLAVPIFRFFGEPSASFPHRFFGYEKLPGVPAIRLNADGLSARVLAAPLGRFLSALHAFPVDNAARAGVAEQRLDEVISEIQADAVGELPRVKEVAPDAPIDAWRRFLEGAPGFPRPCGRISLVHNDLAAEHVLFDVEAQVVTGVIDWSDVAISDPVVDFAGLFHWGGDRLLGAVLEIYDGRLDAADLHVARYLAACRGAMDVGFGLDRQRPEYLEAGLRALRLATDVPHTHNT